MTITPPAPAASNAATSDGFALDPAMRTVWFPLITGDDLDAADGPVARTLCGEAITLFRGADGRATALPDRCSHRNAPLSDGRVIDGCIECPYHGWIFGGDGTCVAVPSSGPEARIPPKAHLPALPCEERYGLVWVALEPPTADIVDLPWEHDDDFRRLNMPVDVWQSAATRMIDNFMDISHFPWVHIGTFGSAADLTVPPIEMGDLPGGFTGYAYDVTAANSGTGATASGQDADTVERSMSTGFQLPFVVRSTIRYETGLEHIIVLLMAPIDDVSTYFAGVFFRNDGSDAPAEETLAFDYEIAAEDKRMLERIPGPLPLGNDGVVSVQSDRPSVEWKRQFNQFLAGR